MVNRLISNFYNSIRGLRVAQSGFSFRMELLFGLPLLIIMLVLSEVTVIRIILIANYLLLLAVELINTAIELVCNRITEEYDASIRDIKDVASSAVLVILILNLVTVLMVLISIF